MRLPLQHSLHLLLLCLLTCWSTANIFAQTPMPHQNYNIDNQNEEYISTCDLPFMVYSAYNHAATDRLEWVVVKGQTYWFNETSASVQVNDYYAENDTLQLAFNVWSQANNLVHTDTILFHSNMWPGCEFIDRSIPNDLECGDTLELYSYLDPFSYPQYSWYSPQDGNEIEILDPFTHSTKVVIKQGGSFEISGHAFSNWFSNQVGDQVFLSATCPSNPVTQANAGGPLDVEVCQFPYTLHSVNKPATGETSSWRVISGDARYFADQEGNFILNDVKDYARLEYSITDGVTTTKDTLEITVNAFNSPSCDLFSPNTNVNCLDTVIVYSNLNSFGYQWTWQTVNGAEIVEETKDYAKVVFKNEGSNLVLLDVVTPEGLMTYTRDLDFNVTCPSNPVTQADAGGPIFTSVCEFPYTLHTVNAPAAGETSSWRVISGEAHFTDDQIGNITIEDASQTAELEYSITDGVTTTKDTLQIYVDNALNNQCDLYAINTNVGCADTIIIYSYLSNFMYQWSWTFPAGTEVIEEEISYAKVIFKTGGNKEVRFDAITPWMVSTYTEYLNFNVTCPTNPVTQADAGSDFEIPACGFPFTHQVGAPLPGETASWNDLTGGVYFNYDQNGHLHIDYAEGLIEMEYVLTDGVTTTRDTVEIRIDEFAWSCQISPEYQTYNCQDTVVIDRHKPIHDIVYERHWIIPNDAIVIDSTNERIRLVFTSSGLKTIEYSETHTFGINPIVYQTFVDINCDSYIIEGTANINQNHLPYGVAYLMSDDETNLIPIDSTPVNYGDYRFDDVALGDYTVYVVPYTDAARTEIMSEFLPTYYVNKAHRKDAHEINVYDNTYSVDIALIENTVSSTTHEVEVELPVVFYDGYIPTILVNENGEIICAAVPIGGYVTFDNLVNGTYYLEIPSNDGYVQSEWFTVSAPYEQLKVNASSEPIIANAASFGSLGTIKTFPNPFEDNITIQNENGGTATVTVYTITGAVIYEGEFNDWLNLNTSSWTSGTYMVRVVKGDDVQTLTIVKQ